MRLLADLCIARLTIEGLRSDGHEVLSLAEAKLNPTDQEILAMAVADGRIVLTEDVDSGRISFRPARTPPGSFASNRFRR